MNIASLVVRAKAESRSQVERDLRLIPGVEIAFNAQDGPLIVTVEDTPERAVLDAITEIHRLPGVIAASHTNH
jgi:nitrate reductase NapAB chaperone NapD